MATGELVKQPWDSIQDQFRLRQPIRPFVSSTFTDFHEEREHLVKYVFPQLNSLCHQRGTYFAPVDLRWGISEDQSHAANVISLCLDYIQHCHPFFICLLGERYGTHRSREAKPLPQVVDPGKDYAEFDWLGKNFLNAAAKGHDWLLQEAYHNCSITELEIIEAAFRNDNQFCRFYIRDPRHIETKYVDLAAAEREQKLQVYRAEDEETEILVTDLKYRIANKGLHVQSFLTVGELGQKVLDDWITIINQCYPPMMKLPDGISGEQFMQWALGESLAETRRRVFVSTPETVKLFHVLDQHALSVFESEEQGPSYSAVVTKRVSVKTPKADILTLIGDRGCGKSALVANWLKQFTTKHSDVKVIAHYVGSSSFSTDIVQFMRRTIWELRGKPVEVSLDINKEDLSSFHEISEAFLAAIVSTPCVLVLDGLDELGGTLGFTRHQIKELFWLPEALPKHCQIIATTVTADLSYKALTQRKDNMFYIAPLFQDTTDKASVLERLLALHCKCLNKQHLEVIISAKLSSKPLFLSIVANELKLFGTYAKVQECLEQYTSAGTFRDLWRLVILRWTKDYGWTKRGRVAAIKGSGEFDGWVADTLRLIACSREGLTEQGILKLLKKIGYQAQAEVNTFQFALFRSATFDRLVERPGGLLTFGHEHLREAVQYFLLGMVPGLNSPAKRKVSTGSQPSVTGMKLTCHKTLADYFQEFPQCRRKAQELPYHYLQCEDYTKLQQEITKPEMFLALSGSTTISLTNDLIFYWRRLQEEEVDVLSSVLDMVKTTLFGSSTYSEELAEPQRFSDADSFCSDLDSVASSTDSRLESMIGAMRDIEVRESHREWNLSGRAKQSVKDTGKVSSQDVCTNLKNESDIVDKAGSDTGSGTLPGHRKSNDGILKHNNNQILDIKTQDMCLNKRSEAGEMELKENDDVMNHFPSHELEQQDKIIPNVSEGRRDESLSFDISVIDRKNANEDNSGLTESYLRAFLGDETGRTEVGDNRALPLVIEEGKCLQEFATMDNSMLDGGSDKTVDITSAERDSKLNISQEASNHFPSGGERLLSNPGVNDQREGREDKYQLDSDDDASMVSLSSEAVRSQSAMLAVQAGRFLAERSAFTQAAHVLQLGLGEVTRCFPLNTKEQFLLAEVQEALGNLSLYQLHINSARTWYERALDTIDNMCLSSTDREYKGLLEVQGRLLNCLGNMSAHDRKTEEAEAYLSEATRCMEQCSNIAGQATAQYNLGLLRSKTGHFAEAETHLRKALYTREHWYGKSHPGVAEVLNHLAGLLSDPLNKDSCDRIVAEALYQRALKIRKTVYGDDHMLVATTLFHLGKLLKRDPSLSCRREAVKHLTRALDIRTRALGPAHKLTNAVRTNLKQLEQELKRGPIRATRGRESGRPRSSTTANSEMTWHKADLDVLDRRIEESRTKYLHLQKYGRGAASVNQNTNKTPHQGTGKPGSLGRERVKNKHLQAPRYRARSSSPAVVRGMGGHERGRGGYQGRGRGQGNTGLGRGNAGLRSGNAGLGSGRFHGTEEGQGQRQRGQTWHSGSPVMKRHLTNFNQSPRGREMAVQQDTDLGRQEKNGSTEGSWTVQTGGRRRHKTVGAVPNESLKGGDISSDGSRVTQGSHRISCNIPGTFDVHPSNATTVHGLNSSVKSLLQGQIHDGPKDTKGLNANAWYHEPGRYPKDANDTYPPRRQQKRPNRFEIPEGDG